MKYFILDTGLLLGFCRKAPFALKAREQYQLGDTGTTSPLLRGSRTPPRRAAMRWTDASGRSTRVWRTTARWRHRCGLRLRQSLDNQIP